MSQIFQIRPKQFALPIPTPVADFTATPVSGNAPLQVQFTFAGSGTITKYRWDFEETNTTQATAQNPLFTYNNQGTFDVTLEVSGPGGFDSITKTGFINATVSEPFTDWSTWNTSGSITPRVTSDVPNLGTASSHTIGHASGNNYVHGARAGVLSTGQVNVYGTQMNSTQTVLTQITNQNNLADTNIDINRYDIDTLPFDDDRFVVFHHNGKIRLGTFNGSTIVFQTALTGFYPTNVRLMLVNENTLIELQGTSTLRTARLRTIDWDNNTASIEETINLPSEFQISRAASFDIEKMDNYILTGSNSTLTAIRYSGATLISPVPTLLRPAAGLIGITRMGGNLAFILRTTNGGTSMNYDIVSVNDQTDSIDLLQSASISGLTINNGTRIARCAYLGANQIFITYSNGANNANNPIYGNVITLNQDYTVNTVGTERNISNYLNADMTLLATPDRSRVLIATDRIFSQDSRTYTFIARPN